MAVGQSESGGGGRRILVGANVAVGCALAVAVVSVLQWGAYKYGTKFDWTSTGVNSLSEGTNNLLKTLDVPVRLTSAYFETDLEEEDQSRYRAAVTDLLDLYASTNRSQIEFSAFNPIHDHAEREKLLKRLAELPQFKEEAAEYQAAIDRFETDLIERMSTLVQSELEQITELIATAAESEDEILLRVRMSLEDLAQDLTVGSEEISDASTSTPPRYKSAVAVMRTLYRRLADLLTGIGDFGQGQIAQNPNLSEPISEFLGGARARYETLAVDLKEQQGKLPSEKLELDEIIRGLTPTGNALIVEAGDSAELLSFRDIWPSANPDRPSPTMSFADRAFKGEQVITSAILRLSQKEKSAVVFVRYGGPALLTSGFVPGQPQTPAPYREMKVRLEDLNFDVYEWNLKSRMDPPAMDPEPTRKLFVIFKPEEQNPFQQQQQPQLPFGPRHQAAITDAIGEDGRAIFMGGWFSGPFPGMPTTYPFADYLRDNWGIELDLSALILKNVAVAPGKWQPDPGPMRQGPVDLVNADVASDHLIVRRLGSLHGVWSWCADLQIAETLPEGVTVEPLLTLPREDGLWGVTDVQAYQQMITTNSLVRSDDYTEGPFTIAVAATKGDAKIIVFGTRDFAMDRYTRASRPVLVGQSLAFLPAFPANITLFANSLHWLNDDEDRMELGRPIAPNILTIESKTTVTAVRALVYAIWPALAMSCGLVVWQIRRR